MKKLAIITGGSKGLGKALVESYLAEGYYVVSISRSKSELVHERLTQMSFNLAKHFAIRIEIENVFRSLFTSQTTHYESITLIHNAATLGEIKPLHLQAADDESLVETISINLTSPILINAHFLRHTAAFSCPKNIFHISSGAATKAYYGWTGYCSTKAGMEMMVKSLALENAHDKNLKIVSINPGVIDTDMQAKIRKATTEDFPIVERFIQYKNNNGLANPIDLAQKLLEIAKKNTFESGETIHLQS